MLLVVAMMLLFVSYSLLRARHYLVRYLLIIILVANYLLPTTMSSFCAERPFLYPPPLTLLKVLAHLLVCGNDWWVFDIKKVTLTDDFDSVN